MLCLTRDVLPPTHTQLYSIKIVGKKGIIKKERGHHKNHIVTYYMMKILIYDYNSLGDVVYTSLWYRTLNNEGDESRKIARWLFQVWIIIIMKLTSILAFEGYLLFRLYILGILFIMLMLVKFQICTSVKCNFVCILLKTSSISLYQRFRWKKKSIYLKWKFKNNNFCFKRKRFKIIWYKTLNCNLFT